MWRVARQAEHTIRELPIKAELSVVAQPALVQKSLVSLSKRFAVCGLSIHEAIMCQMTEKLISLPDNCLPRAEFFLLVSFLF
jgi:hypothetical protein